MTLIDTPQPLAPAARRSTALGTRDRSTVVLHDGGECVRIPASVRDLNSFRRWAKSEAFPTRGWYSHLDGELWVDLSMERLGHNQIKTKFAVELGTITASEKLGRLLGDRMLLTHVGARLSTEPDGMFLSYDSLRQKRVRLREGSNSLEVEGTPDMVLEVVSPTSRQKDTVVLRQLYWRAGIPEYWLVDPLGEELAFDILQHGAKGYVAARRQAGGWSKSKVFNRSFRLVRGTDPIGDVEYTVDSR